MPADLILSREGKSLQEEDATAPAARNLALRCVNVVALRAALICVVLLVVTSALGVSDGGLLIVRAYAQSKQQNPLEKARRAVETLINRLRGQDMPEGIVKTNGRLEATQVDVAAKYPGRLATLTVDEGDEVTAGQVVATISSPETEAQLRGAQAQVLKAKQALAAAVASIAQRKSELDFSRADYQRAKTLVERGNISCRRWISAATDWTRPRLHMFRPMPSVTKPNPQSNPRGRCRAAPGDSGRSGAPVSEKWARAVPARSRR